PAETLLRRLGIAGVNRPSRNLSESDALSANHSLVTLARNRLLGSVGSVGMFVAGGGATPAHDNIHIYDERMFVADAAPRLAHDIITIDDERVLTLHWRRLATRESPRTAAGPIHSCAGRHCVGP